MTASIRRHECAASPCRLRLHNPQHSVCQQRVAVIALSLAALLAPRFARAQSDAGATPVASSAGTPPADAAAPTGADPSNTSIRAQRAGSPPNGWMIAAGSLLATSYAYQLAMSMYLFTIHSDITGSALQGAINLVPTAGPIAITATARSEAIEWFASRLLTPPLIALSAGLVFLSVGLLQSRSRTAAVRAGRSSAFTIAMLPVDHGAIATLGVDWSW